MSELVTRNIARSQFRLRLLATVSALALATRLPAAQAHDDESDHATVWIELGGQLERMDGGQDAVMPPFLLTQPRPAFEVEPPAITQKLPRYAVGGEAKLTFTPRGI